MRLKYSSSVLVGLCGLLCQLNAIGDDPSAIKRSPWTQSRIQGSPDPPLPYVWEQVFPDVKIDEGLEMVSLDGRLFVMQRRGQIWSFPESPAESVQADLFIDLRQLHPELEFAYGMAFHPNWRQNHYVFVTYTDNSLPESDGTRLSRFTFQRNTAGIPQVQTDSEQVILTWRRGGHNGANVQFGPDGMLYISTGDATPPNPPDELNTGQDNSDWLSAVLRIDIDHGDGERPFSVPSDNPYVNRDGVRPEIWAFGFRNPWKMSFDSKGRLWLGDVGWELWEMIHRVEKGGNYGWSAMEGENPIKPHLQSDLAPISPPVAAHPHSEAASITGGYEYRSDRLPELQGAYVYGDYETGILWSLHPDKTSDSDVVQPTRIADTPHKIATFGLGNEGDLYYIHYGTPSTLFRLIRNPKFGRKSTFPTRLSETGLFADVAKQQPSAGVYGFEIHEPMWRDGAVASRWIALPEQTSMQRQGSGRNAWPENSVLAKTIRLGSQPVETQVLHFDGDAWNAYSYRWNETVDDAELVDANGETFEVSDLAWRGGKEYRIASRAECLRCHNMWNQFTAAFEPMQLASFSEFAKQPVDQVAVRLGLTNERFFQEHDSRQLVSSHGDATLELRDGHGCMPTAPLSSSPRWQDRTAGTEFRLAVAAVRNDQPLAFAR
ncbi:MAG: PQQ-dependent sugar dehydrogenase [Pirellulaceae bacterium]